MDYSMLTPGYNCEYVKIKDLLNKVLKSVRKTNNKKRTLHKIIKCVEPMSGIIFD